MKIIEKNYTIVSPKLYKDCYFMVVSDIHFQAGYDFRKLKMLLSIIIYNQPDFVCIPGDILERVDTDNTVLQEMLCYLNAISQNTKTFVSLGNHDIMDNRGGKITCYNEVWFQGLRNIPNLTLLHNQSDVTVLEPWNIAISGFTLPLDHFEDDKESEDSFLYNYEKLPVLSLPTSKYRIALFHAPNTLLQKTVLEKTQFPQKYDLLLSGHMHGGLVPPVLEKAMGTRGFVAPERQLFPKYTRGHFQKQGMDVIISTGFSKLSNSFDPILPPEIVHVNIKKR